ncbi:haloacetate dehalogenase [Loktanella fryxellensis]|uniref:Haloacetate dehalogenase n=1 Tax=Loktanella fryxellensis TaxID=245187 RepID=A0A1H7ZUJ2_9RHOB|nr:alpha/beta hydrolase [Loktanella fryxellensis]SEM61454.1 haloacetate dehalogenase [Loktanella fryxellensis]
MIAGFTRSFVPIGEVTLSVHRAGRGVPLILLHGYPQNHHCWARVAPRFAQDFDVIVPDLRGYGDSDAPADDADHTTYAKRTMARDIVGLMDALGLDRAHVLGHDRGARVAYRLALDHPERVRRLGIIEIVPTGDFWAGWTADLAMKAYHWTFLAQPAPLPERMIAADAAGYTDWTLTAWTRAKSLDVFAPDALDSYRAQMAGRAAAMCADYRAGATTDRRIDDTDRATGARISAPLHFLWAEAGFPAQTGDPLAIWQRWAWQVTGNACRSGHFAMEENPQAVLDAFVPHFRQD